VADLGWSAIAAPLLSGAGASFVVEQLLKPRPLPLWRRSFPSLLLHIGLWLLLYAPLLMLLRRPWFTSATMITLLLLVVLVSNAKFMSLREPFIYQDLSYFVDALRFPRLYLPFLGIWSICAVAVSVTGAVVAGLLFETPLNVSMAGASAVISAACGTLLLLSGSRRDPGLQLEPAHDLKRLGLLSSLWQYAVAEHKARRFSLDSPFSDLPTRIAADHPNLVVIQSESFFDPRRWLSEAAPDLLKQFDALKQSAVLHGPLQVPAWGANTVRTEFAFLSGIANDQLGIHRFKPYRRLARREVPTLAGFLKQHGYLTVCLHPYSSRFYNRDTVFTLLGFDEFIDISCFSASDYAGQYVGDEAVAREVCKLLGQHDDPESKPLFLFVITMENHGPLHLEQVTQNERVRYNTTRFSFAGKDLTAYLRHLENADRMLGIVREKLENMKREGVLCLFGDHLPIMPEVYAELGEPDGTVDYLVWSTNKQQRENNGERTALVEELARLLVVELGL